MSYIHQLIGYIAENIRLIKYQKRVMYLIPELELGLLLVPKVASSSIKKALCIRLGIYDEKIDPHQSLLAYMVHTKRFADSDFYKISIIRDPIERLLSCYKHVYMREHAPWKLIRFTYFPSSLLFHAHISFERFVDNIGLLPGWMHDQHFQSQYTQLYHGSSCLVDQIFYLEQVHELESWLARYDIHGLSMTNKNPESPVQISQETKNKIKNIYHNDYAIFNFLDQDAGDDTAEYLSSQ